MMMRVLTTKGLVEVNLDDPDERSIVGGHWNAIGQFTKKGHTGYLAEFDFIEVGKGLLLETDPDAIEQFWFNGELDFLDVYTS